MGVAVSQATVESSSATCGNGSRDSPKAGKGLPAGYLGLSWGAVLAPGAHSGVCLLSYSFSLFTAGQSFAIKYTVFPSK